jgi:asparagine synthase (glutamine-hydrolysing)
MCGIAGFFDASLEEGRRQQVIGNMLEAIAHRGPDARDTRTYGALTLGHNRLSIIDLSEEANQPMERDGYSLIFNGEVYNYVEIREELRALGGGLKPVRTRRLSWRHTRNGEKPA